MAAGVANGVAEELSENIEARDRYRQANPSNLPTTREALVAKYPLILSVYNDDVEIDPNIKAQYTDLMDRQVDPSRITKCVCGVLLHTLIPNNVARHHRDFKRHVTWMDSLHNQPPEPTAVPEGAIPPPNTVGFHQAQLRFASKAIESTGCLDTAVVEAMLASGCSIEQTRVILTHLLPFLTKKPLTKVPMTLPLSERQFYRFTWNQVEVITKHITTRILSAIDREKIEGEPHLAISVDGGTSKCLKCHIVAVVLQIGQKENYVLQPHVVPGGAPLNAESLTAAITWCLGSLSRQLRHVKVLIMDRCSVNTCMVNTLNALWRKMDRAEEADGESVIRDQVARNLFTQETATQQARRSQCTQQTQQTQLPQDDFTTAKLKEALLATGLGGLFTSPVLGTS
jgi:hypothetical protein